jgi:hypothetical protein
MTCGIRSGRTEGDKVGQVPHLVHEGGRFSVEVDSVAHNLNAGPLHDMVRRFLAAFGATKEKRTKRGCHRPSQTPAGDPDYGRRQLREQGSLRDLPVYAIKSGKPSSRRVNLRQGGHSRLLVHIADSVPGMTAPCALIAAHILFHSARHGRSWATYFGAPPACRTESCARSKSPHGKSNLRPSGCRSMSWPRPPRWCIKWPRRDLS